MEAKDRSPGGNEIVVDTNSPAPAARVPESASAASLEGDTLILEEEEHPILSDYEIAPEISPPPPPSANPESLSDIDAAGNTVSENGKHPIPSDHDIAPDTVSPPAPAPARRPEPASTVDPEVNTPSVEGGHASVCENKVILKADIIQDHGI